ncbi:hypothetical protein FOZ62_016548, partial [Perkinsus olseni]
GKSTSTASAQATTSSTAPDLSSAQSAAPATPNVKISGVDPNENNDAPSDSSDDDNANGGQSNTIRVHQLTTTSTTTTEEAQDQVKLRPTKPKNHVVDHQRQDCPTVRSTPMSCSSSTTSTRCDIVVGVIKIGPETRPVLFDTGADISLIAIGTLKKIFGDDCPTFSRKTRSNVKVANTDSMEIIGFVGIPIASKHITINERFAVTDNSLSSPVILGCPALKQLQCAIIFTAT